MTQKNIAIIIPARFGSTRFPGKPLAMIAGQTMLSRVVDVARAAVKHYVQKGEVRIDIYVTTDDQRIADHASDIGVECLVTGVCATGSDRVLAAASQLEVAPDFILNLQGDAPLTPVDALVCMIDAYVLRDDVQVVTPVQQLSWESLDRLRENKKTTPFSGTTVVRDSDERAIWFSKNIIPAVRKEDRSQPLSPIYQHIGLYGYRYDVLAQFCQWTEGHYEALEGLEQLRFLENGVSIQTVALEKGMVHSGVDSPEDIARAEAFLAHR